MSEYFKFHFEGQFLTAIVKDGFIHKVFVSIDSLNDTELNITDDIAIAFSYAYSKKEDVR